MWDWGILNRASISKYGGENITQVHIVMACVVGWIILKYLPGNTNSVYFMEDFYSQHSNLGYKNDCMNRIPIYFEFKIGKSHSITYYT